MPYSKDVAVEKDGKGNVIGVFEMAHLSQPGEMASLVERAKKAKEEAQASERAEAEESSKREAERALEARKAEYWATWRLALLCECLTLLWQEGVNTVGSDEKASAVLAIGECMAGDGRTGREIIARYPILAKDYESMFGKEPE